jgi:glycosyltransferase involved in cell wall biosynthesis
MKLFTMLASCLTASLILLSIISHKTSLYPEFISFDSPAFCFPNPDQRPRVLHFSSYSTIGCVETYQITLQKLIMKHQFNQLMVVCKGTPFQKKLIEEKIPHFALNTVRSSIFLRQNVLNQLRWICKQHDIDIVHTHAKHDADYSIAATRGLATKTVFMYHMEGNVPARKIRGLNGVLAVNLDALNFMREQDKKHDLGIKHFKHLFVLVDKEKFLGHQPSSQSRHEYFKKYFDTNLTDAPVICMLAQFYRSQSYFFNRYRKNHALLIKALAELVHKKNKPINLLFAGSGPALAWHKKLVKELNLEKHVHFLGFCTNTQDILHYSDFHVLSSKGEAFGAVHIEAGLMKKASVGAAGTGADYTIAHQKTGLLFENDNVDSLADALEFLIDHPILCQEMGKNAFDFATGKKDFGKTNFTFLEDVHVQELIKFYHDVMKEKQK